VLVAGAGAVGQWLGGRLLQDGHDTTLLCRPAQAAAINGPGLVVRGHTTLHGHPKAVTEVLAGTDPFEVIVLTCKAHQTAPLAAVVAPHLKAGGTLVSLQNGLGNGGKLLRVAPPGQVALALTSHGLTLEAPGHVHHAGLGPTLVGPAQDGQDRGARMAFGLLARVGLEPEWRDAMRGPVWRKALVNHAINPVAALHGVLNGQLARRADLHEACLAVLTEGEAVARKAGVDLGPGGALVEAFEQTVARTGENACSMLQDVRAKRPTEVEQITGRLVRLAQRNGVAVPRSQGVYRRLKDLEASYLGADRAARLAADEAPFETDPL
jgi:2-dehydropantoate 2-reductase